MDVEFEVDAADEGKRVDAVIAARTGAPRTAVQRALRAGGFMVDGRSPRPSQRLEAGQAVRGRLPDADPLEPAPEQIPLAVRYSDDRVLVISKPAGLVVHPDSTHRTGTLVNALLASGEPLSRLEPGRPGIVHRLDKDTSGLLLVAKDDDTQTFLVTALKRREIERRYYALVRGTFATSTGTIDAPVGRHSHRRRQMAVTPGGRAAVTHYRVIDASKELSLLDVKLETGRTHQIRVHLAHVGHPVLGDRAYGGAGELARELGLDRPFLHAWSLAWPDSASGDIVRVTEPLPDELVAILERAGLTLRGPSA